MGWLDRSMTFLQEVISELKRTTWPKWPEVRGTTTVVIVAIFIFAVYLWVVDLGLGYLYRETIRILR